MHTIRPAAVAGTFYPGRAEELARHVSHLLGDAAVDGASVLPKAVIVPHAGYVYSGPIAASAYSLIQRGRAIYRRVVLLGPVHRVPVRGLATAGAGGFATPLGVVPVAQEALEAIGNLPQVVESIPAHAREHSLEVQLPFLQQVLDDFTMIPLAVGNATAEEVAEVLEALWGGPETLIVISSDLSHFLPYDEAREQDSATVRAILELEGPIGHEQACGGTPVNGLLLSARRRGLKPRLLDLRNSGDTAGDRSRVVGYASFTFTEETGHA
jgi:AmmeMemoRadiSam system protein B